MQRRLRSVGPALFSSMAFVIMLAAGGCTNGAEDVPATASPTTTGIPMGAPGAQGVRFDPPAPKPRIPSRRLDGVEQKVNPGPGGGTEPEPAIPPSPFGTPPDEDPPPPPIKKKPSGGTQL